MNIRFFGDYLVETGFLTKDQFEQIIIYQEKNNLALGELAIKESLLSNEDIENINTFQKQHDKKFGESALELKLLTHQQLEDLLDRQKQTNKMFGQVVIEGNYLTKETFKKEYEKFLLLQKDRVKHIFKELAFFDRDDLILNSISIFQKVYLRSTRESIKIEMIDFFPESLENKMMFIQNILGEEDIYFALEIPEHKEDILVNNMMEFFIQSVETSLIENEYDVSKCDIKKLNSDDIDLNGYCKLKFITLKDEVVLFVKI